MSLQGFCLNKKKRNQKHLEDTKRSLATKKVTLNKSKFKKWVLIYCWGWEETTKRNVFAGDFFPPPINKCAEIKSQVYLSLLQKKTKKKQLLVNVESAAFPCWRSPIIKIILLTEHRREELLMWKMNMRAQQAVERIGSVRFHRYSSHFKPMRQSLSAMTTPWISVCFICSLV